MIALIKTIQVILALSILILVHEFGHFIFSKIFGIRVDKFYLFFDAGDFRLLSRRAGNALLSLKEYNRFSKGLFAWIGFRE